MGVLRLLGWGGGGDPIDGNGDGIKDGSTIQPNNISESRPQNIPLFPLLALDTSGPVVTSTDPINGTTEVPLDKVITATFNETVQSSTVNSSQLYTKNWQYHRSGISLIKLRRSGRHIYAL